MPKKDIKKNALILNVDLPNIGFNVSKGCTLWKVKPVFRKKEKAESERKIREKEGKNKKIN